MPLGQVPPLRSLPLLAERRSQGGRGRGLAFVRHRSSCRMARIREVAEAMVEKELYAKGVRISLVAISLIVMLTILRGIPPWLGAILVAFAAIDSFLDWRKLGRSKR